MMTLADGTKIPWRIYMYLSCFCNKPGLLSGHEALDLLQTNIEVDIRLLKQQAEHYSKPIIKSYDSKPLKRLYNQNDTFFDPIINLTNKDYV